MPHGRLKEASYRLTYWTVVPFFSAGWGLRATGRENVPLTGPVLLLANHQSFIDPLLIGTAAPRWLTYLARSNLWRNKPLGRFISHYGGMPIDRGFGRDGLTTVLDTLGRGEAVVMFPEGERTRTGAVQPLKPGVHLLLKRVTCPVVPVGVAGAYDAWPRHLPVPIPAPLRGTAVAFGEPIRPAGDRDTVLTALHAELVRVQAVAERLRPLPAGKNTRR